MKLRQWRSRRSGSPTVSNTWKKSLVIRPWPWTGKKLKESFKPDTNSPSLEMQLDKNNNHSATVTEDLNVNRDTPGAVEPSTNLFLDVARTNYTWRRKAPSTPMPSSATTAHYTIPSDGILPGRRLQCFSEHWKRTILHSWPVSIVTQGYQLQWNHKPRPWKYISMKFTEEEQVAVDEAVKKFLNSGIIEHSPFQCKSYLSKSFTVKGPNRRRPMLDCRNLNQYIQCNHFKMEGVPALRELLDKNDYICKLDLKDAYVVMPIHENSRDYLTFFHQGVVYKYKSLAFGLNVSPQVFSKLIKYTLEPLRKSEIRFVFYLDNIHVLAKTKEEMQEHTSKMIAHLEQLGFLINREKSILEPQRAQSLLSFLFNSQDMTIQIL